MCSFLIEVDRQPQVESVVTASPKPFSNLQYPSCGGGVDQQNKHEKHKQVNVPAPATQKESLTSDIAQKGAVVKWLARPLSMPLVASSIPGLGNWHVINCKNMALNIRDCEYLCLSEETLKAVGPFYLVSMPGEVKDPTQGVNV